MSTGIRCARLFLCLIWLPHVNVAAGVSHVCESANGNDRRLIEVIYQEESALPCKTFYSKGGFRKQIAWAKTTAGKCEQVAQNILTNLMDASFSCSRLSHSGREEDEEVSNRIRSYGSDVDLYLEMIAKYAEARDPFFEVELEHLASDDPGNYLNEERLRSRWDDEREIVSLGGEHGTVWAVRSARCHKAACDTILAEVSGTTDAKRLSVIKVLKGHLDKVLDCVEKNGLERCWDLQKPRPIIRLRDYIETMRQTIVVEEYIEGRYQDLFTCHEGHGEMWEWKISDIKHSSVYDDLPRRDQSDVRERSAGPPSKDELYVLSGKSKNEHCMKYINDYYWSQISSRTH